VTSRAADGGSAVGELGTPFADVRRIAVLRGGGLGDLVLALPALEALRATYPDAELTLLGTPGHAELLRDRPVVVDDVEVLPVAPGIRLGDGEDPAATSAFLERMRARRFDLAVQMHGGGRNSNPFVLELGARHTVGPRTEDAAELERSFPYVRYQHETLRDLEIVALAGATAVSLEPRLPLTSNEVTLRTRSRSGRPPQVVLHPGATDPRRQWPGTSFAELAASLADDGVDVVIVGDATDVDIATTIAKRARALGASDTAVRSVAGQQSLRQLLEQLVTADVVVANDSGPRHLAAAVGTATVGIFWIGNLIMAEPFSRGRHRVELGWATSCPICGADVTQVGWTAERCDHDESYVAGVSVPAVVAHVRQLLLRRLDGVLSADRRIGSRER
jgi:ADP-heptose:LPS heptosyltransferase